MTDVIEQFGKSHHSYNEISPERAHTQIVQLRKYEAWLDGAIEDVDTQQFQRYLEYLMNEGYNANSVVTYMSMIKSFYSWCRKERIITGDQLLDIREVKKPKGAKLGVPKPYSTREMTQFWLDLDEKYPLMEISKRRTTMIKRGTANLGRMRCHAMRLQIEAIVMLGVCCGLRRQEVFKLSLDDLHHDNAYLPVIGKGDKEREVPYTEVARDAVVRWLEFRKVLCVMHDKPWIRAYGPEFNRPMSLSSFAHQMEKIGDGYQLHRLRHSAATNWLREGMPIQQLQRFLGHADINQTLRYAELNREDIFKTMAKLEVGFTGRLGLPEVVEPDEVAA